MKLLNFLYQNSPYFLATPLLAISFYFRDLCVAIETDVYFSELIESQEELGEKIEKLRDELNISDEIEIDYYLSDNDEGYCSRRNKNSFKIAIGGHYAKETVIEHEMYHLKRFLESDKQRINYIDYLFNEEPRAVIYQITGLKF